MFSATGIKYLNTSDTTKTTSIADSADKAFNRIDELKHLLDLKPAAAGKLLIARGYTKDPEKDKDGNDSYSGRTGSKVYLIRLHHTDIGYTTNQADSYNNLFNSVKKTGLKPLHMPDGTITFSGLHSRYMVSFNTFKGKLITTYNVWIFDPNKVK